MKRTILITMMAMALVGAWAQTPTDLSSFEKGFNAFSAQMAPTLSYNATVGNNWSDSYIGNLPHLGLGLAVGATAVPIASLENLFTSMGIDSIPTALKRYGLPIPATALTLKIGGLILPFDIGVKAMLLPGIIKTSLAESGVAADYSLFGGNIRYAILKEGTLLPDVSIGAGYNRLSGAIVTPLGISGQSFKFTTPDTVEHTLAVTDPDLALRWVTDSFDFTLQASKKILFIEPFLGLGLSMGKSSVKGGIESEMLYDGTPVTESQVASLKADLKDAGIDIPDISAEGFMFGSEYNKPVFRAYGGITLSIFVLKLDTMVMYVPSNKSLGLSTMLRLQF